MSAPVVLLVEDDADLRHAVTQALTLAGFDVRAHATAESALAALGPALDGVVVTDVRLPRMDGMELLDRIRAVDADIPVILITGHGDVPLAVTALRRGAFDFLTKPFAVDHLVAVLTRANEQRRLRSENRALRAAVLERERETPLLGDSAAMTRIRALVRRFAAADLDVLVEGERGTGKSLTAALLHTLGPRRSRPLIPIDLATLAPEQAELDLFGHAADSVAHTRLARRGAVVAADTGTLLIENVDAASSSVQARLLRLLEDREVLPLGAERPEMANVRIVATVTSGAGRPGLRGELIERLALGRLVLPPLRERDDDAAALFAAFMAEAHAQLGLADGAAAALAPVGREWHGNVRELRAYAFRAAAGEVAESVDHAGLRERAAAFESTAISAALQQTQGNVVAALALLKIPRKTLYEKLTRYGIQPEAFRRRS